MTQQGERLSRRLSVVHDCGAPNRLAGSPILSCVFNIMLKFPIMGFRGEFKFEVIFFPRGAPRGETPTRGGPWGPGGGPWIWRKKSKDKTLGVFCHAAFEFDTPGP